MCAEWVAKGPSLPFDGTKRNEPPHDKTNKMTVRPNGKGKQTDKARGHLFPMRWPQGYHKENEQKVKDKQTVDEHYDKPQQKHRHGTVSNK